MWCVKKAGKELREKAELVLAWRRVQKELQDGTLGTDVQAADLRGVKDSLDDAEDGLVEEVWASYRFVVIADSAEADALRVIDLGSGHASSGETLGGRILAALKSESRLNDSVGASYLERNWPAVFKESGAWPLASLRKCFLDGSLTRLVDPDKVLRDKIPELVGRGEVGFAAGERPEGGFNRLWFNETLPPEEIEFVYDAFVVRKDRAKAIRASAMASSATSVQTTLPEAIPAPPEFNLASPDSGRPATIDGGASAVPAKTLLRVKGAVPPELWNRFGSKIIPKLRSAEQLQARVELTVEVEGAALPSLETEIQQILSDLDLIGKVVVEKGYQ